MCINSPAKPIMFDTNWPEQLQYDDISGHINSLNWYKALESVMAHSGLVIKLARISNMNV